MHTCRSAAYSMRTVSGFAENYITVMCVVGMGEGLITEPRIKCKQVCGRCGQVTIALHIIIVMIFDELHLYI